MEEARVLLVWLYLHLADEPCEFQRKGRLTYKGVLICVRDPGNNGSEKGLRFDRSEIKVVSLYMTYLCRLLVDADLTASTVHSPIHVYILVYDERQRRLEPTDDLLQDGSSPES